MSARQAARWKRAACSALARIPSPNRRFGEGSRGFGSHLGGLRVPVAQSSQWALAAPSARFAPSQISAFCALAARSPCICSHLRTTQRGGATPKMVAVGRSGPCPQLIRYRPARFKMRMRGLSRASGASQASAARNARTPAQAFRAPLRRKKRGLPLQQARRAIAPFALPPRQALPRLPLQAPGASHPARASVSSVRRTQETRLATPSLSGTPEPSAPHHPSEVWRAAALQNTFRIQRHARWIRQPCVSKATLRRPPPGEVNGAAVDEVGGRRTPAEKIGASRAFPPSESYLAFASLYTPSHHRIGNWITAAMTAVYSTHTSARPKCPPSRATPLKYT